MISIYEKRRLRQLMFSPLALIILLILFIILVRPTWGVYKKQQFASEHRREAEQQLTMLEGREETLRLELGRLGTDRGVEAELRGKYDVGREGERLLVLVDAPNDDASMEIPPTGLWAKMKAFFGF